MPNAWYRPFIDKRNILDIAYFRFSYENEFRLVLFHFSVPGPVQFWDLIFSYAEIVLSWTCHVSGLWTSNIHRYLYFPFCCSYLSRNWENIIQRFDLLFWGFGQMNTNLQEQRHYDLILRMRISQRLSNLMYNRGTSICWILWMALFSWVPTFLDWANITH